MMMSDELRTCCQSSSPRELSQCPEPLQEHFMKAWEAIEKHDLESVKQSISRIKTAASAWGASAPLDVFHVLKGSGMIYVMSLIAFSGVHGQKEIVELLLDEGAKIDAGCDKCGAPLLQMLFHCFVQEVELDITMVQFFIMKRSPLSRTIYNYEASGDDISPAFKWSLLDLPLTMPGRNGLEVAKVLVELGKVDPITGGTPDGETFGVVPMFQEYCYIGTNNYIHWLFNEHIPSHKRVEFVDRILKCITSMKKDPQFTIWTYEQRTPSHGILTSRHQEAIALLVEKGKQQGEEFLKEANSTGKTALHMAAKDGDLESVKILLQLGADTRACDNSDLNPFMLALVNHHKDVANFILKGGPACVSYGKEIIDWALEKNLILFFQVFGEVNPNALVTPFPNADDNTIVHMVTAAGNTEVFEMILKLLWSNKCMQQVVECYNRKGKTALQLGIENNCTGILKTLEAQLEKQGTPSTWQSALRDRWRTKIIPPLFLHASSCGSLTAVKYFIDNGYKPTMRHDDRTPLQCAAKAGHDEIVKYLLQFRDVSSDSNDRKLSLLQAATNGHTSCVILLLKKDASVLHTNSTGEDCLILATKNLHKETAMAILSEGFDALKWDSTSAPLQLLIQEMPRLAEYVLNRHIMKWWYGDDDGDDTDFSTEPSCRPQTSIPCDLLDGTHPMEGNSSMETDGDSPEGSAVAAHQYKHIHILKLMIKYKRLKLLQHPMVKEYLRRKFWLATFPLFLGYLLLYCVFLILLTTFALVSPRPGPDSETCPEGSTNITTNGTNCTGQSGVERGFLAGAAGLILLLCCALLSIEAVQLYQRRSKYFKEFVNYFQVILFILTISFVAPGFANNCWCAHNWQWQFGALALSLGWFNLMFLLKDIPWTAIPIIMFINICTTFLKVMFLPFLLLMAFALPFYMVYVPTASASGGAGVQPFASPARAIAHTMVQIVGEIDFEAIFNQGDFLYNPITYTFFVIFLITTPVLFINLLIGLAVGDTNEEKEKAEFTKIEVQVDFILERERNSKFLQKICNRRAPFQNNDELFDFEGFCFKKHFTKCLKRLEQKLPDEEIVKQCQERNKAIFNEVMTS